MVRVKKLNMLFARIRSSYDAVSDVISILATKVERIIVYEHNERADNIHIHFLMEGNKLSTDTIKNYFKRHGFEPGDNGCNWSFASATDRGAIVYMSKGVLEPKFIKGYENEEIDDLKKSWIERTKGKYQTKIGYVVRETPSEAKKRKNDLVNEMVSDIKNQTDIVRVIIKTLNANNIIIGRYTIRDYFDTIRSRLYTEQFVDSMEKFCWDRI